VLSVEVRKVFIPPPYPKFKRITLKTLTILLFGLTFLSCQTTESKSEPFETTTAETTEPDYKVAITFINDYLYFTNVGTAETGLIEWFNNRKDVTVLFKSELKRILNEAEKIDPELGLGFDPLLDAQDSPSEFEFDKADSEFLIVKGKDWPDFQLTLKMKLSGTKWLVDGAGIVNIPENKRIKR
jgi:hypothetical protein